MSTKLVTIRIDRQIHQKARELGLNISKTCENCLKEAIQALEDRKNKSRTEGGYVDTPSVSLPQNCWWAGPDLNQRPSARQADVLPC